MGRLSYALLMQWLRWRDRKLLNAVISWWLISNFRPFPHTCTCRGRVCPHNSSPFSLSLEWRIIERKSRPFFWKLLNGSGSLFEIFCPIFGAICCYNSLLTFLDWCEGVISYFCIVAGLGFASSYKESSNASGYLSLSTCCDELIFIYWNLWRY